MLQVINFMSPLLFWFDKSLLFIIHWNYLGLTIFWIKNVGTLETHEKYGILDWRNRSGLVGIVKILVSLYKVCEPVADPGFPQGGAPTPKNGCEKL